MTLQDLGVSREMVTAMLMDELKRQFDYNLLHNPWVFAPDPLIHSLRWMKAQRPIRYEWIEDSLS